MRKLAIFGIILLILVTALATWAVVDVNFRNGAYNAIEGTLLLPIHDWVVSTWIWVGNAGFTFIFAASVVITVFGALFGYFIAYGLFYKRLIQGKILGNTPTTTPTFQASPTQTIPVTGLQNEPTKTSTSKGEES